MIVREMGIWQCLLSTDRLRYAKYGKVLKELHKKTDKFCFLLLIVFDNLYLNF